MSSKREIIQRKYNLANDENVKAALQTLLEFVVDASTSSLSAEKIQGMLILLNEPNNWIKEYDRELNKAQKENSL